ncbi:DUF3826 domain-containing protein [Pelagicoccus sp. SDUM812005]|uniref:DUF3826 domain-containing protein n=1 Tax=Pelagicoccus sp. SDUM812005 TaxID=3041257 RepID=UPI00280CD754|nr:DUF3826 domain-containing protein [Pelagicoccus sp. SDUM812005]MDQ8179131.1 DUF3826 domain-containing protein [Pelagicoccus sp. SDUM812005]
MKIEIFQKLPLRAFMAAVLLSMPANFAVGGDSDSSSVDAAYWNTVLKRSERIVSNLSIEDPAKSERVIEIVARQYVDLRSIHDARDAAIDGGGTEMDIRQKARLEIFELHFAFLAKLSSELDQSQVEHVKDGMTYGVVPKTYRRYMMLLPDLGEGHKRWIYAALVEAREHAMNEGTSDEKHKRFGQYKGRINNYLSALGINMKEAERALAEREKAQR